MTGRAIARERWHTLLFLRQIRDFAPVFLDTEVDMTAVCQHRAELQASGQRMSTLSYVLWCAARVMTAHPAANSAIAGTIRPKVAAYSAVHGKITLDKSLGGERIVLSAVLPDLQGANLAEIQSGIEHYRDGDPAELPEFSGVRALHRLPWVARPLASRLALRPLRRRPAILGTFAVTSLGHRPVDGFYSVGGTTVTLGLGQIADRAVVRDGQIQIAPIMRLNLTFDHRVIDGAEAADVLADTKDLLEQFGRTGDEREADWGTGGRVAVQ